MRTDCASNWAGIRPRNWVIPKSGTPCRTGDQGERHEVEYITTGTIYVTAHQTVALADDGNEFLDEEILGWRLIPYFPSKEVSDDVHNS